MNKDHSANYWDRIEFTAALMAKDYTKARDVANQLLKHTQDDIEIISALNILEQKKMEKCQKSSSIDSPIESDNECSVNSDEESNSSDGNDIDSVNDNTNIHISPRMENEIASYDVSKLKDEASKNKTKSDIKQKMYRVIQIKMNNEVA